MAKKGPRSGAGNKTKAVQEYYAKHPDASPADVQAALKEQGVDVLRSFISTTKWHLKRKQGLSEAAAESTSTGGDSLNKSTEIRNLIAAHPELRNKDVLDQLLSRGIAVTPTLVSNVRKRFAAAPAKGEPAAKKRTLRGRKPGPKPASAAPAAKAAPAKAPAGELSYDSIKQAKLLVDSLGGDFDLARSALDALAQLRGS